MRSGAAAKLSVDPISMDRMRTDIDKGRDVAGRRRMNTPWLKKWWENSKALSMLLFV
jgi:hypothetical protein